MEMKKMKGNKRKMKGNDKKWKEMKGNEIRNTDDNCLTPAVMYWKT